MLHLLSALLDEKKSGNLHKLKDYLFFPDEKPAYNYILNYVNKYNSLPELSTCRQNGYELPTPTACFDYYLDVSKDRFVRHLISTSLSPDKVSTLSTDPKNAMDVLDMLRRQVSRVYSSKELTDIYSGANELVDFLNTSMGGKVMGISTGSELLDGIIHGLKGSDLMVLFARPGVGKTYFLLSLARAAMLQGKRALFINNEMSDLEIQQRFWGMMIGLNTDQMYSGNVLTEHFAKLEEAKRQFRDMRSNLYVVNPIDPLDMSKVRDYIVDLKPDIVFVDSAYMLEPDPSKLKKVMTGIDKLNSVVRDLRFLAKHQDIPIISVAQANRDSVGKKVASTSSIAGSDYWSQMASVMLHLDNHETDDNYLIGTLVKNRGGKSKIKGKPIQFLMNNSHNYMKFGIESILGDVDDEADDESNERGEVSW